MVSDFLERIPQDSLANVSYSCQAFTRALMHLEIFVKNNGNLLQEQLDFMQVYLLLSSAMPFLNIGHIGT